MGREHELYKDKIEVSLDGRQIFYLFFGGAVIVGMVFVLGVMVGRRVEARGHVDRSNVAATVDPGRAARQRWPGERRREDDRVDPEARRFEEGQEAHRSEGRPQDRRQEG